MNGGLGMDIVKKRINANDLLNIISIPNAYIGKDVEVVVRDLPQRSIVDELFGIASNLKMSPDEIRGERIGKYEVTH